MSYLTQPGDLILDPFLGSGTSVLVALKMGRRAIGIELSEKYIALAQRRLEAEVGLTQKDYEAMQPAKEVQARML